MSELTDRLRNLAEFQGPCGADAATLREAATELDRLESIVGKAATYTDDRWAARTGIVMADLVAHAIIEKDDGLERHAWWMSECDAMKARGMTFFRWSYQEDKPDNVWIEGWRDRPADQGPLPWEIPNG